MRGLIVTVLLLVLSTVAFVSTASANIGWDAPVHGPLP